MRVKKTGMQRERGEKDGKKREGVWVGPPRSLPERHPPPATPLHSLGTVYLLNLHTSPLL
jgi:hypothetical protein